MNLTAEQREEWAREMPVLAAIIKTSYGDIGDFVKTTQFGDLYLKDEQYTLVTQPDTDAPSKT